MGLKLLLSLITFISVQSALAQSKADSLPVDTKDALEKTQQLLRDPHQRQHTLNADPKAKAQDASIERSLGGTQNKQRAYEISADIMENIVVDTGGDSAKMEQLLMNAQNDPKGFYDNLTDAQKKAIRELAGQVSPQLQTQPQQRPPSP